MRSLRSTPSLRLGAIALAFASLLGCEPAPTSSSTAAPAVSTTTAAQPATKPWWQEAVVYQIWPRSFADSDGDGAGDFNGIKAKLPYLADLGADALWLTPIFEAPSYHGYDFTEFYGVERDYGTIEDFKALVTEAKSKNIRIILDLVINHISDRHVWFQQSAAGVEPYKDYFIWRKDLPTEGWGPAWDSSKVDPKVVWHFNEQRQEYYYAAFGASQPDLNLTHPDVVAEMKKMAKFWLDLGVAGFRLDAVRYAVENGPGQQADTAETIAYWQDFSRYVRSIQPDVMLVGEAWADLPVAAKYYGGGEALDAGFDFEFGYKVLELLQSQGGVKAEFGTMAAQQSEQGKLLQANYEARKAAGVPMGYFSPFLTNHDQPRLGWQLQGDQAKAKLAAAMLLSSPGSTYIYYGEEIGMTQQSDAEHIQRRAPMLWQNAPQAGFTSAEKSWVESDALFPPQQSSNWWQPFVQSQLNKKLTVAEQQSDAKSLWSLYKYLIGQKKTRPEYSVEGSYQATALEDGKLLQIVRELNGSQTVMLLNLSAEAQQIPSEILNNRRLNPGWVEQDAGEQLPAWQLRTWQN